jgi:hypothetical protein
MDRARDLVRTRIQSPEPQTTTVRQQSLKTTNVAHQTTTNQNNVKESSPVSSFVLLNDVIELQQFVIFYSLIGIFKRFFHFIGFKLG